MTTPDTAAVRTWARKNGFDVADRGRLRPEVLDAYEAAQRKPAGSKAVAAKPAKKAAATKAAPAKKAATAKAPAAKAPAAKAPADKKSAKAPAKKAPAATAPATTDDVAETPAAPAAPSQQAKPKPVTDDRRLVALGEELASLTERVAQLEKQLNGKSGKSTSSKSPRFRRSK